jgi:hypothetical protein
LVTGLGVRGFGENQVPRIGLTELADVGCDLFEVLVVF